MLVSPSTGSYSEVPSRSSVNKSELNALLGVFMRRHMVTAVAVLGLIQGLVVGTVAAADRDTYQPEGAVYVSFGFGGPALKTSPLHYGLLMRYDDSALPFYHRLNLPPLFTLDFDGAGDGVAKISGIPFMRHIAKLNQNGTTGGDGDIQTTPGNFTVVDWGLLGLGVNGIGYGISQVVESNNSPNPPCSNNQNNGSGGLPGGDTTSSSAQFTPGLDREQPGLLLLDGIQTLAFGVCGVDRPDPRYMQRLNSGTGQMGDLYSH